MDYHLRKLKILILFFLVSSCEGEFISQEELPSHTFEGVKSIKLLKDRTFLLSWNIPSTQVGNVKYQIYAMNIDTVPEEAEKMSAIDYRKILLHNYSALESPEYSGTLLDEIDNGDTTYKINQKLDLDKNIAFQVKAINDEGLSDKNTRVIIIQAKESIDYEGCLSYVNTENSITLTYEFPETASKVNIYRDGQIVYTAISNLENSFTDINLYPASKYRYICEAVIDDNYWAGKNILDAETVNPLREYFGCISGKALSGQEIKINYYIPEAAEKIVIRRDGKDIFSVSPEEIVSDKSLYVDGLYQTSYNDRGLKEGVEYSYQCVATLGEINVKGEKSLTLSTINTNAPTFKGIMSVDKLSANEVKIHWGVTTGVPSAYFQIYYEPGQTVDFNRPYKTIPAGDITLKIDHLGDELDYSYGVRACSNNDQCDLNTKVITVTMDDGGAPKSIGIEKIEYNESSKLSAYAPWDHSDGAIKFRRIFRMTGETSSNNFGDYSDYGVNGVEFQVVDPLAPPTILELGELQENTTYHFILRDYDAQGTSDNNMNVFTYKVGDLTPPLWPQGISTLESPSDVSLKESALVAKFLGVSHESDNSIEGASSYLIYILELTPEEAETNAKDSCKVGSLFREFSVDNYVSGQLHEYIITGLKSKTFYSVCMKVKDLAGNISDSKIHRTRLVYDITPPIFSGIKSITIENKKIRFNWNPSPSNDIDHYKIVFWNDNANPNPISLAPVLASDGQNFFEISPEEYPNTQGDSLYAIVNACDDFNKYLPGNENCTSFNFNNYFELLNIPDLVAPLDFSGITEVVRGNEDGKFIVHWETPLDRSDYAGYAVYKVTEGQLEPTPLKNCACDDNGDCENNNLKSCSITVDPGRAYYLTVLAFDSNSNVTDFDINKTSPLMYAPDFTPPEFINGTSNIEADFIQDSRAVDITFNKALDNQYDKSPSAIAYNIYRNVFTDSPCSSSNFTIGDIPNDPTLLLGSYEPSKDELEDRYTYRDVYDLESNKTYLYRIEAIDQQNVPSEYLVGASVNATQDTTFSCVTVGDMVKPVFQGGGNSCPEFEESGGCISINKTNNSEEAKTWTISWDMIDPDNGTPQEDMITKVYVRKSDSENLPDLGENLSNINEVFTELVQYEAGALQYPLEGTTSGPVNQDLWIHYLVVIMDKNSDGTPANKNWTTAKVFSENKIEITGVTRTEGTSLGGKLVLIHGKGFTENTRVYFKSVEDQNECLNPKLTKLADFDNPKKTIKKIVCTTPPWAITAGDSQSVRIIIDIDGALYTSPPDVTYTFYNYEGYNTPDKICDSPTYPNEVLVNNTIGRNGSTSLPYIICSPNQLHELSDLSLNFVLEDNIDLSNYLWSSSPDFRGILDGKGHYVYNAEIQESAEYSFLIVRPVSLIKNINLIDFSVDMGDSPQGSYCSLFITAAVNGGSNYELEFNNINLTGNAKCNSFNASLFANYIGGAKLFKVSVMGDIENKGVKVNNQVPQTAGIVSKGNTAIKKLERVIYKGNITTHNPGYVGGVASRLFYTNYIDIKADVNITDLAPAGNNYATGIIAGDFFSAQSYSDEDTTIYVENIEAYGTINAPLAEKVGCLAGRTNAPLFLNNALASCAITAKDVVGGLIGDYNLNNYIHLNRRSSIIQDSSFDGTIYGNGLIGGFVGRYAIKGSTADTWNLTITNSLFNGNVIGTGSHVGGFVGNIGSSCPECGEYGRLGGADFNKLVSKGKIKGDSVVGGIVGGVAFDHLPPSGIERNIAISEAYVGGEIEAFQDIAGGIVGSTESSYTLITKSYVDAKIIGRSTVGGIIGKVSNPDPDMNYKPSISNSYSAAIFNTDYKYSKYDLSGGIFGQVFDTLSLSDLVSNTYYNFELSLSKQTESLNTITGTSKETDEFNDINNFNNWKSYIWEWYEGYPHLKSIKDLKESAK